MRLQVRVLQSPRKRQRLEAPYEASVEFTALIDTYGGKAELWAKFARKPGAEYELIGFDVKDLKVWYRKKGGNEFRMPIKESLLNRLSQYHNQHPKTVKLDSERLMHGPPSFVIGSGDPAPTAGLRVGGVLIVPATPAARAALAPRNAQEAACDAEAAAAAATATLQQAAADRAAKAQAEARATQAAAERAVREKEAERQAAVKRALLEGGVRALSDERREQLARLAVAHRHPSDITACADLEKLDTGLAELAANPQPAPPLTTPNERAAYDAAYDGAGRVDFGLETPRDVLRQALKGARLRVHAAALPMSIAALEVALTDETGTLELLQTVAKLEGRKLEHCHDPARVKAAAAIQELQGQVKGRLSLPPPVDSSPLASGAPAPTTVADAPTTPAAETPAAETPVAVTAEIGRVLAAADAFEVLGVGCDASEEDVDAAFKALRAKVHPDKNGNSQESTDAFTRVSAAYESVPQKRCRPLLQALLGEYTSAATKDGRCLGPFTNAPALQNTDYPRAGVSVCLAQAIDEVRAGAGIRGVGREGGTLIRAIDARSLLPLSDQVIEDLQFKESYIGTTARGSIRVAGGRVTVYLGSDGGFGGGLYTAKQSGRDRNFIMPNVYVAYSKFISSAAS